MTTGRELDNSVQRAELGYHYFSHPLLLTRLPSDQRQHRWRLVRREVPQSLWHDRHEQQEQQEQQEQFTTSAGDQR
ncbi:MAG: hypothetical protein QOD87_31 [Pseudonocardiales bacterium]|nr:hypothetical protein [Pseudonocardiales bacterium]